MWLPGTKSESIPGTNSTVFNDDALLVKFDSSGNIQWEHAYHITGSSPDNVDGVCVIQTSDGGYILTALDDYSGDPDDASMALIKTDANGNMEWNKTIQVNSSQYHIVQTNDGYLIAHSNGGLLKTDLSGNEEWDQSYGLSNVMDVIGASDGGYVVLGDNNNEVSLVKLDSSYNEVWSKTL